MNRSEMDRHKRIFSYCFVPVLIAVLLSILPVLAITKATELIDAKYLFIYFIVISAVTIYAYWVDKKRATNESWRTPEKTLHLLELAGGWLAAFFSQRVFRHKISKKKYQIYFWMIVAIHQFAAFDYLNEWYDLKAALNYIKSILMYL